MTRRVGSWVAIEQAKGALMLAYGLNEDGAFAMLRWWFRHDLSNAVPAAGGAGLA